MSKSERYDRLIRRRKSQIRQLKNNRGVMKVHRKKLVKTTKRLNRMEQKIQKRLRSVENRRPSSAQALFRNQQLTKRYRTALMVIADKKGAISNKAASLREDRRQNLQEAGVLETDITHVKKARIQTRRDEVANRGERDMTRLRRKNYADRLKEAALTRTPALHREGPQAERLYKRVERKEAQTMVPHHPLRERWMVNDRSSDAGMGTEMPDMSTPFSAEGRSLTPFEDGDVGEFEDVEEFFDEDDYLGDYDDQDSGSGEVYDDWDNPNEDDVPEMEIPRLK